jgi:hypothetical protein
MSSSLPKPKMPASTVAGAAASLEMCAARVRQLGMSAISFKRGDDGVEHNAAGAARASSVPGRAVSAAVQELCVARESNSK